ncbi:UNVERIFIED_CONTAM: hypothetical protein FKN15_017774 [Acipenser sinensis]
MVPGPSPGGRTGHNDFSRDPSGSSNGPWHLPSARTGHSDFAQGPRGSPIDPRHLPTTQCGLPAARKWSLAHPSACMGPSDLTQGPRGSANGPWHLPIARTDPSNSPNCTWLLPSVQALGPATQCGLPAARKWSLAHPSACMGPSDLTQGPRGSANGPWHLPIARTDPSNSPNCTWLLPSVQALGPATQCGLPAARKWSLAHPSACMGPSDLTQGPRGSANGPWHLPIARTDPSNSPNCTWLLPSVQALGPATQCGLPAARKWSLAHPSACMGPSDLTQGPRGSANGPWHLPIARTDPSNSPNCTWLLPSVQALGPATQCGLPAARKWSLAHPSACMGPSDLTQGPRGSANGPWHLPIARTDPSNSPNCTWLLPSVQALGPATQCGLPAARKWSLAHPSACMGPSDLTQGPRGSANGPWHLPIARTDPSNSPNCTWLLPSVQALGPATQCGLPAARKWSLAHPSACMGPSDLTQGPRGSANGPWHLPIARTDPSNSPNCTWLLPSVQALGPATQCGLPAARKWSLAHPSACMGPSDLTQGPRGSANGPWHLPIARTDPSNSPNCTWLLPSVQALGPATQCGLPAARKWSLAHPSACMGPSDLTQGPRGSANGPWHLPIARTDPSNSPNCTWLLPSVQALGPATQCGLPAARKWSLAHPSACMGPSDLTQGPRGSANGPWHLPIARTDPSNSPNCTWLLPSVQALGPATQCGLPAARKWSLAHPSACMGPSDLTQGPRGSANGPWHLPIARTDPSNSPNCTWLLPSVQALGPATQCGLPAARKWSLAHPSACMGPSDLTQGPRGSANGPWHLPIARTDPSNSPNCTWLLPSVQALGPATQRGVPAVRKWSLAHPSARMGHSDLTQVPRGSANVPWHLPSVRSGSSDPTRGPSGSSNGPWHLTSSRTCPSDHAQGLCGSQMVPGPSSARAQGRVTPRRVPEARKWSLAHPSARMGHSDLTQVPRGSANVPWHLPSVRSGSSDPTRGPSCSSNGPRHLPSMRTGHSDTAWGPSGSQMVPGTSQCTHGAQRPHASS